MVFFCFFFLCRYSGWHQAVYAGADSHYTEGFAVPVLEDESSGSSCHGINCQTDRLPCTSTSGNSAVCTAAGPARENMDWEGKKGTVTLRALVQLLVLEAESAVFFVREDDIQESRLGSLVFGLLLVDIKVPHSRCRIEHLLILVWLVMCPALLFINISATSLKRGGSQQCPPV